MVLLTNFFFLALGQTIIGLGILTLLVILITNYMQNKNLALRFNEREDTILRKVTNIEKFLGIKPKEPTEEEKS